ncbi:hypothetical protein KAR91_40710 [Candidatus Pacearchaeota archaeon]|nr:hypothetical protein [Candidatus Pacearchaeota archaeon]
MLEIVKKRIPEIAKAYLKKGRRNFLLIRTLEINLKLYKALTGKSYPDERLKEIGINIVRRDA